jgi:hypothetical protein
MDGAMTDKTAVASQIRRAFAGSEYPGDPYIQGSHEGCEPSDEVGPFAAHHDWTELEAAFLDRHYNALSFFSEAGFRYFLPAYLLADLDNRLSTADPLFHLTHGFHDAVLDIRGATRTWSRRLGASVLLNPRRYGAITFADYSRFRLSVFTREEAAAIVAYLQYKRETDPDGLSGAAIDAALRSFWLERAERAPASPDLARHVAAEHDFLADMSRQE